MKISLKIKEGEGIDIEMEGTQPPLKLFIVYPGDEIFLCLEMFPYKADIKPVDISPKSWSETWISLEMKTIRENWKIEPLASSKSQIICIEIRNLNSHFIFKILQLASNKCTQR